MTFPLMEIYVKLTDEKYISRYIKSKKKEVLYTMCCMKKSEDLLKIF